MYLFLNDVKLITIEEPFLVLYRISKRFYIEHIQQIASLNEKVFHLAKIAGSVLSLSFMAAVWTKCGSASEAAGLARDEKLLTFR